MLMDILYIALGLVLLVVAYAASLEPKFSITRNMLMQATPEKIFAQVNDFHNWQAWSPWEKLDPKAQNFHEGPEAGIGSTMRWQGNSKVGTGSMTITESQPPGLIRLRLDFLKPMPGTSETTFTFVPENGGTRMTWTMSGKSSLPARIVCHLFMDMDKMIGKNFEDGMSAIKAIVEA